MKARIYWLIILLMGVSAVGMTGLQGVFLYKQYRQQQVSFDLDVQRALAQSAAIYAQWNSHTSSPEDAASFNTLYANADSTFIFMIAQTAQPYPLLDFRPDTLLPKQRKEQFLRFGAELEQTRRRDNPHLREFYLFRTIQYCADCGEEQLSITRIFPLDSLIRRQLALHHIGSAVQIGFFHRRQGRYAYLSAGADSTALDLSVYTFDFTNVEQARLFFPDRLRLIAQSMILPLAGALGLILVSLCSFWLALRIIFRQKKLSELKNDFINNVTHEFKTPISTIAFAVANIENDHTIQHPDQIRQFTKVIKDENRRLNQQVEKVMQAAVSERKALALKKEPVNLHFLINDLADAYELKIGDRGLLHRKFNAARAEVLGDSFHLSNAISNLLDNALKYSGPAVEITLSTDSNERGLSIRVADKGIGISRENQALIFDRFYRVPNGNLHQVKGFGLGLSYVRDIVDRHGGSVHVRSKPNQGSTFSIFLPYGTK